jgi:hypothetical protein
VETLPSASPLYTGGWQPLQVKSPLFQPQSCQVFSCQHENFVLSLAVLSHAEHLEPFQIDLRRVPLEVPLVLSEMKE